MQTGRRPNWPPAWVTLAEKCGGSVPLRQALGYRSKTTLSAKIAGRKPWTRADYLLLVILAVRHDIPTDQLLPPAAVYALDRPDARPVLGEAPNA